MKQEKVVLALTGPQLAGKGRLIGAIEDWCGVGRVTRICTGDLVRKLLCLLGFSQERPDCDRLVRTLATEYGQSFLAEAVRNQILASPSPVIIFDSMRLITDLEMVQSLEHKTITVYVTASPEVRHARLVQRGRNGEASLSFAEFMRQDELATEKCIREIGERADVQLRNDGSEDENEAVRMRFCKEYLASIR